MVKIESLAFVVSYLYHCFLTRKQSIVLLLIIKLLVNKVNYIIWYL